MITDVIVELKHPVKEEFFHIDTVLPSEYYGYGTPLIRCKDCKFSMNGIDKYNERYILCQLHERSYGVTTDGFCKWAERKEE